MESYVSFDIIFKAAATHTQSRSRTPTLYSHRVARIHSYALTHTHARPLPPFYTIRTCSQPVSHSLTFFYTHSNSFTDIKSHPVTISALSGNCYLVTYGRWKTSKGPSSNHLAPFWCYLGAFLKPPWSHLGRPEAILGSS